MTSGMNNQQQSPHLREEESRSAIIRTHGGKVVRLPRWAGWLLIIGIIALALFLPELIGGLIYSRIAASVEPDIWALFFIVCAGCLALCFGLLIFYGWQSWRARKWATAPGVVTRSELIFVKQHGRKPHIVYRYQVGNQIYESSRIEISGNHMSGGHYNYKMLGQFPVGKQVPVFFNPKNPAHSALVHSNKMAIIPLILLTAIFFAATLAMLAWRLFPVKNFIRKSISRSEIVRPCEEAKLKGQLFINPNSESS